VSKEELTDFLASIIEIFLAEAKDRTILCLTTSGQSCEVAR